MYVIKTIVHTHHKTVTLQSDSVLSTVCAYDPPLHRQPFKGYLLFVYFFDSSNLVGLILFSIFSPKNLCKIFFSNFEIVFIYCAWVHKYMHVCHMGKSHDNLWGVGSLLLCGSPRSDSGCQPRQQAPWPAGPSHWPCKIFPCSLGVTSSF